MARARRLGPGSKRRVNQIVFQGGGHGGFKKLCGGLQSDGLLFINDIGNKSGERRPGMLFDVIF